MDTIQELQIFRTQLIQEINVKFDDMIQQLRVAQGGLGQVAEVREYESVYPLTAPPAIFKGKKPTGVRFPDGTRENVPTWKKTVEVILVKCNRNSENHRLLMGLRDRVSGRDRVFLGSQKESMRSPVKIDENLYIETHYDTETLLRILTTRILNVINYDYSGITIAIRNDA